MRINENNYVDKAEEAIKSLVEESKQKCRGKVNIVTTSKIRNLLAMTADIYNQVLTYTSEKLDDEICGRIEYRRIWPGSRTDQEVRTGCRQHLRKSKSICKTGRNSGDS